MVSLYIGTNEPAAMNTRIRRAALPILHYTVGSVIFIESALFVFSYSAARSFNSTHLPIWIRPALGGLELVATALFLIPPLALIGGYALLGILILAAVIHILHGWYDVGSLLISAAAVLVCVARMQEKREPS
jgi:hypothetical protein